ncbi:hypothetical protein [Kibdelosporangium aridum]|uniref:hypothetical protein n=1 Tax=Kibdelosporangium aridum TaxID=2030 RepID=UPI00052483E7
MRIIARAFALAAAGLLTFGAASAAAQDSVGAFTFTTEPGAFPTYVQPDTWYTVNVFQYDGLLNLDGEGANGFEWMRVELSPGEQLTTGRYENVRSISENPTGVGIRVIAGGRSGALSCADDYATVDIMELERTADGNVTRFAADIEHHCDSPTAPALRIRVKYDER